MNKIKILSFFKTVIAFLILGFGFIFIAAFIFSKQAGCEYGDELKTIQALSGEQLEKLYFEFENFIEERNGVSISKEEVDSKYSTLKNLPFKYIDIKNQFILVGGCFDNKLLMTFDGVNDDAKDAKISISWGESPLNIEVLWRQKGKSNSY